MISPTIWEFFMQGSDTPPFDPREVYEAFLNGEDLRSVALNIDHQKIPIKPSLSELEEALQTMIQSERERLKTITSEEAKTDMVLALRQEINRLVKFRTSLQAGTLRTSATEIFNPDEGEVVYRTVQETEELPATAITNVTREIRENRKLICAILNLADTAAESDEAFEKALEEASDTGAIIRGQEESVQKSPAGSSVSSGKLDGEPSLPPTNRDDQAGGEAHSG